MNSSSAIVLASGGLDSSLLLFYAKQNYDKVLALTFLYGQNNWKQEVDATVSLCREWDIEHRIVDIGVLADAMKSDYTEGKEITIKEASTYVPNRNILFVTIAHGYAQSNGYDNVLIGLVTPFNVIATKMTSGKTMKERLDKLDELTESGMMDIVPAPDATEIFMGLTQEYFDECSNGSVAINAPFFYNDKQWLYEQAEKWGILELILKHSHSCFNGGRERFDWGTGCSKCLTCRERELAYKSYLKAKKQNGH